MKIEYVEHGSEGWAAAMIDSGGLCQLGRRNWLLPIPCSQKAFHVVAVEVLDGIHQKVCVCKDCFSNLTEETYVHRVGQA